MEDTKRRKVFYSNGLTRKRRLLHLSLEGRPNLIKLTPKDVYLLNAIMWKVPTNWVVVFKWHILNVGINNWHRLPYDVFISKLLEQCGVNLTRENKLTCSKENLIGKATLTCLGLKRTTLGWIFNDELDPTKGKETLLDSNSDQEFPPSYSEFERRVGNKFKKASKRINTLNKYLTTLNEKMDEIFKHYVEISTSSEESEKKDVDGISEESPTETSESK